jgi:tetratricopeptide (TPR) repeat protein
MNPRTHRSVTRRMAFWMIALLASGWAIPSFAESTNPPNGRVYRQPIDDLNAIREHLVLADPADRGHLRFLTLSHLVKLNKLDEAMVHLNRATRHEGRLARAYYEKAELHVLQGNREAALVELDKAIQYEPNDTVYALRRQVLVRVSR